MGFRILNNNDYWVKTRPSHGGVDSGTVKDKYDEASIVMDISEGIANYLEKDGFKVKLTRDKDSLDSDEYFDEYNDGGRAVISHEVYAKYLFSIHVNSSDSSKVRGIELYTASDINYDFAKGIVKGIVDSGLTKVSSKSLYKVDDGIYTHNFSEREISKAIDGYDNKGYKHYNITTNSNYLYMIRETGGIMTGAYVDDSNPDTVGVNPYYDCNRGTEAYLLELGYLTNKSDLNVLTKSRDEYAKVIADAIGGYLK